MIDWLDTVQWNDQGLVPVVAQDHHTGQVLMLAWMNKQALAMTVEEQRAVYWSRSRQAIWRKGDTSGYVQTLVDVQLDCDSDALLLTVIQQGGVACHTGRPHCFFRHLRNNQWQDSLGENHE